MSSLPLPLNRRQIDRCHATRKPLTPWHIKREMISREEAEAEAEVDDGGRDENEDKDEDAVQGVFLSYRDNSPE